MRKISEYKNLFFYYVTNCISFFYSIILFTLICFEQIAFSMEQLGFEEHFNNVYI